MKQKKKLGVIHAMQQSFQVLPTSHLYSQSLLIFVELIFGQNSKNFGGTVFFSSCSTNSITQQISLDINKQKEKQNKTIYSGAKKLRQQIGINFEKMLKFCVLQ